MNKRIIARLPSRRLAAVATGVSASGLHTRQHGVERLVAWAEIDRVTAARAGQVVGDQQMVIIATRPGDMVMVNEAEPVWHSLTDSLHRHLPGAERATMWQLELAGGANQVEVYRR